MQWMKVLVAAILCTVLSGQEYAGSAQCGCLEVPATSTRRRDKFCRPHLTDPAERRRYRSCVCRLGLVRNSWGDCITRQECTSCKCFPDRDFNVCGRECPLVCNEPMSRSCSKSCAFGCDCVSGFVRNSRHRGRCVKATKCGFSCPQFSTFQFCSSTCRPKCGRHPRRSCVTRCTRGDCVCNQGYAEVEHNGETICVPQEQCFRYLPLTPPMTPGDHRNISSGGTIFVPSTPTMPVNPGLVTGGAVGTLVPGSGGINGNVGGGVSSGGTVFIPAAPTTPVTPGVFTGGAVGAPVPGLVGVNGNLSAGVSSGGVVFISGAPTPPVNSEAVTGGGAGLPLPGSVSINGASSIPSVLMGGTGSVVPSVGGGNQPGSLGSSGTSPIAGGAGMGTYAPGGVAARLPESIGAQGRPSGGTNGFGSVGGGILVSDIKPNNSVESGDDTGVDASDIPQVGEEMRPGGSPAVAGSTPTSGPNDILGRGVVGTGGHSGVMPPSHIGNSGSPNMPIGAGISVHGGVGSSHPAVPGINKEGVHPSGTLLLIPGRPSVDITGKIIQNTPAPGIPKSLPAKAHPIMPPNLASLVSSGTTGSVATHVIQRAPTTGVHMPSGNVGVAPSPSMPTSSVASAVGVNSNNNIGITTGSGASITTKPNATPLPGSSSAATVGSAAVLSSV